ncbi:hypothetical protein ACFLTA_02945 [Bacteroidota bacterium]
MNTLIHIGYPKAASTWLQHILFPSIKGFTIVPEETITSKLLKPGAFKFDPEDLRNYFAREYPDNMILSEERFLGSFNLGWNNGTYSKELSLRLKNVFPEAMIVLFIRKQSEVIASAYAQYVKDGGTNSLHRYLYPPSNFSFQNILKFSFEQLEYLHLIRHYKDLFGDRIKIFLYEEIKNDYNTFIERFQRELELELDEEALNPKPINIRYSRTILGLARVSNIFTRNGSLDKYYLIHLPGYHSFSKKIWKTINRSRILGKAASAKAILGKRNFDHINDYYSDHNNQLSEIISENLLKKHGYI